MTESNPSKASLESTFEHTPVALAFGTSGLRGLVEDITDLEAYINVKAAIRYLLAAGDIAAGSIVVIAGDLRPSTDRILGASAQAIVDAGCQVENAGKIPTPALLYHAICTARAGVMVTGSHIPFDRNGIKVNKSAGELLKSDEPGILREVERIRAEEYGRATGPSHFDHCGMFKQAPKLPSVDPTAEDAYVARYLDSFPRGGLNGLRVLVDQHSAVGRDILPRILRGLGADVVTAGRTETFVALDTENITDEALENLERLLETAGEGGRSIDAIVSTDGDSDRPLVVGVLPRPALGSSGRRVRFLAGNLLGIVVAEYIAADAVVVPISANDAVERRMHERGVFLQTTKIGSPYVVAAIDALRRSGTYARIAGWEANGGFLCGSDVPLAGGTLRALPTRDAVLPILANLFAATSRGLPARWDELPQRFGRAGLLDAVPLVVGRALVARWTPSDGVIELPLTSSPEHRRLGSRLASVFTPALGFDEVVRINVLDGIRVYFANGDIAHVRPSGNAPQLRIYANSDSQQRADGIVELALREPDGILRRLLRLT